MVDLRGDPSDLAHAAYHDPLTGLANRRRLDDKLAEALQAAVASDGPLALFYIDLNGFKRINDTLGHAMGDELLCSVAQRLRSAARNGELLARVGGDQFVLLTQDLLSTGTSAVTRSASNAAEAIGHRLTDVLRAPFRLGGVELLIEAAVGVAIHFSSDPQTSGTLAKCADAAMYESKETGTTVVVHSASTPDPLERLELAARLRRGIDAGELELHYQPIVRLPDERIMGVEALVRWRHPERGLLGPDAFIGVAESTGVIEALGDWVLETLCVQAAAWKARGWTPNLGVNVSPRQLCRANFGAHAAARVTAHGLTPDRFVIELTESGWTLGASRLEPVMAGLRAHGFALAIDDFGAGYSSLWRLRELPVQVIKVDRAFLQGVPEDPQGTAVVTAILRLAEACECDVVAEGVETPAQRDLLVAENCHLAQGFHFARPMSSERVERLLEAGLVTDRRDQTSMASSRDSS